MRGQSKIEAFLRWSIAICVGLCILFTCCAPTWSEEPKKASEVNDDQSGRFGIPTEEYARLDAVARRLLGNCFADIRIDGLDFSAVVPKGRTPLVVSVHEDLASNLQAGDLAALPKIPQIVGLSLTDLGFSYEFKHLTGLKQIRYLSLDGSPGSSAELAKALKTLPNLEYFWMSPKDCSQDYPTEELLEALSHCPKLHTVWLTDVTAAHGGLEHLAKLPRLKTLTVLCKTTDDFGLQAIAKSESIETIRLLFWARDRCYGDPPDVETGERWTDAGVKALYRMKNLRHLQCDAPRLTVDCLTGIEQTARLESFSAPDVTTDDSLKQIARATHLQRLNLSGCKRLTDAGLANLAPLQNLKSLDADWINITKAGVQHLAKLPRLEELSIYYTPLKAADIRETLLTFPSLRTVKAQHITQADLEKLKGAVKEQERQNQPQQ